MSLQSAYAACSKILGDRIECFKVTEAVEKLRIKWKPDKVRVVLLAESHVSTTEKELSLTVRQPDGVTTPYVRFVYCLGYGESQLVDGYNLRNRGTPQYWTLFHDTVYGPSVERGIVGRDRIPAKLKLLHEMKQRGIWLVDASVVALYGNGAKVSGPCYQNVLRECWRHHIGEVVRSCAPPLVLVIGREVGKALEDSIRQSPSAPETEVVNQPNARMTIPERAAWRQKIFDFCSRRRSRRFGAAG